MGDELSPRGGSMRPSPRATEAAEETTPEAAHTAKVPARTA
jgi:hypothetical protein